MDETPMFFDRDGQPIDLDTHLRLHADADYRVLARDVVGKKTVVTVWTGLNQDIDANPPLIFGTAVLATATSEGALLEEHFSATEVDALRRHAEVMSSVRDG